MLNRLKIGSKLVLLVVPFGLLSMSLASYLSMQRYDYLQDMQHAKSLVMVAKDATTLIDTLQAERGLTNGYLNGAATSVPAPLQQARGKADAALASFETTLQSLDEGEVRQLAGAAVAASKELLAKRGAVDGKQTPAPEVFSAYTGQIEKQMSLLAGLGGSTNDAEVIRYSTAISNTACIKEYAGRERGFVNGVLSGAGFTQASLLQGSGLAARQQACEGQLMVLADDAWRDKLLPFLQSDAAKALAALRGNVYQAPLGQPVAVTPEQWFAATSAQIGQLKSAQESLLEALNGQVDLHIAEARTYLYGTIGISAALILLLLVGGMGVYRSIRNPIVGLSGLMTAMSRDLDLAPRAKQQGDDEIAAMANAFDHLVDTFAGTLKVVKQSAHGLMGSATALQGVSARAAVAAETQSESSTGIAAAVEQMTVGIASVSDNTQENLEVAQMMQRGVTTGRNRMQQTTEAMKSTAKTVDEAGALILGLADKSQSIRQIITAIRDIADQTNLLALNAAIEAARAGEMGRGFAVVADEVRKLAERTGKETVEITHLIEVITNETATAANQMQMARGQMDEGLALVRDTLSELDAIHGEADQTAAKSEETAAAMREQTAASNEVAVNISKIASLAEENATIVEEAADLASRLNDTASNLVAQVDRFKHTSH